MDFNKLLEYIHKGYIKKITSPCGRLFLLNYTDKCTYERLWNNCTLNSRGHVYETQTNKRIAIAMKKFFNFEELSVSKQRNLFKQTEFEVTEKVDGSLGIIYYYDGEWRVNTRGSFNSEQAIEAKKKGQKKTQTIAPRGCNHCNYGLSLCNRKFESCFG